MNDEHKSVIADGSVFHRFQWGSHSIVLRALSLHEIEWIEREYRMLGLGLPNDLDHLVWSFVSWDQEYLTDFSLSWRKKWASKMMKLPLTVLDPMVKAFQKLQTKYFDLGKTFYTSLVSPVSRQLWGMYCIHGEDLFKKFHFWNDYQTDFFLFHRREDTDERLDFIYSGFKLMITCFTKPPEGLMDFKLSRVNSENTGSVTDDVKELDAQIKDEIAGVEDKHARILKAAEEAYIARVEANRRQAEQRKKEVVIPDIPAMLFISPEDLVKKSRERRRG